MDRFRDLWSKTADNIQDNLIQYLQQQDKKFHEKFTSLEDDLRNNYEEKRQTDWQIRHELDDMKSKLEMKVNQNILSADGTQN